MIEKIGTNQIQEFLDKSSKQTDPTSRSTTNEPDVTLQVDYAALIEQAKQIPEADPTAVERAAELIESGRLDSPENIQAAAENIVDFGV